MHKYKQKCFTNGIGININSFNNTIDINEYISNTINIHKIHFTNVIHEIKKCIDRNTETIIIPLLLFFPNEGHANVLIYRRNDRTIEHYEPHGLSFDYDINGMPNIKPVIIYKLMIEFVDLLNQQLMKNQKVFFVNSSEVCPIFFNGFQYLEEGNNLKKEKNEGGGYCLVWSLFFIESVLKNPKLNSNEVFEKLSNRFEKNLKNDEYFVLKFIRGYVNYIYTFIENHFYETMNYQLSSKNIIYLMEIIRDSKGKSLQDITSDLTPQDSSNLKMVLRYINNVKIFHKIIINNNITTFDEFNKILQHGRNKPYKFNENDFKNHNFNRLLNRSNSYNSSINISDSPSIKKTTIMFSKKKQKQKNKTKKLNH